MPKKKKKLAYHINQIDIYFYLKKKERSYRTQHRSFVFGVFPMIETINK